MRSRNLMPSYRRESARRRRLLKVWAVAVAVYAAALLGATLLGRTLWGVDTAGLALRRQATRLRIEEARRRIQVAEARLAEARRTLQANRRIAGHPDWSLLLALLAQPLGEGAVLRGCILAPAKGEGPGRGAALGPAPTAPTDDRPTGWRLQINGFARTVTEASTYALALEKTGLFSEVRLLKTVRRPFLAGEATHFEIEAALSTPPPAPLAEERR